MSNILVLKSTAWQEKLEAARIIIWHTFLVIIYVEKLASARGGQARENKNRLPKCKQKKVNGRAAFLEKSKRGAC